MASNTSIVAGGRPTLGLRLACAGLHAAGGAAASASLLFIELGLVTLIRLERVRRGMLAAVAFYQPSWQAPGVRKFGLTPAQVQNMAVLR